MLRIRDSRTSASRKASNRTLLLTLNFSGWSNMTSALQCHQKTNQANGPKANRWHNGFVQLRMLSHARWAVHSVTMESSLSAMKSLLPDITVWQQNGRLFNVPLTENSTENTQTRTPLPLPPVRSVRLPVKPSSNFDSLPTKRSLAIDSPFEAFHLETSLLRIL